MDKFKSSMDGDMKGIQQVQFLAQVNLKVSNINTTSKPGVAF
jgi:hypothetical protein